MNPLDLKPLSKMWERVENARDDDVTAYFNALMYAAEMVVKFIPAALVAAIDDNHVASRDALVRKLVSSNGIGVWPEVLWETLAGPPSKFLLADARREQRELIERVRAGEWQYEAVSRSGGIGKHQVATTGCVS